MTNTLDFIKDRFNLNLNKRQMPITIPNFGRDQLAELLPELGFNIGVEIGVAAGAYSETLMKANPQMKLYGVDPWEPHRGYKDYVSMNTFDKLRTDAENRLGGYPNYELIRKYSMDAVNDFDDESLDFVYIDADHSFRAVTEDIDSWLKKVRKDGIIAGHDYVKTKGHSHMHVKHVVPAYTDAWGIKPWFVLGNDANDEGLIREPSRSWMWVKS